MPNGSPNGELFSQSYEYSSTLSNKPIRFGELSRSQPHAVVARTVLDSFNGSATGNGLDLKKVSVWAFGSQSTYILPNDPRYVEGSDLAPFVYMADRWAPAEESVGTYVVK